MKATAKFLAFLLIGGLLSSQAALARQGPATLEKLREQVARLASLDRDPATPPEVKELNATFLAERRAQLRDALRERVKALESYVEAAGSALGARETQVVGQTIDALGRELRALESGGTAVAAAVSTDAPVEVASLKLPSGDLTRAARAVPPAASEDRAGAFSGSLMPQARRAADTPTCETELSDSDEVTYTVNNRLPDGLLAAIQPNGSIAATRIDNVIAGTLYPSGGAKDGDYAIVHVIRWEKVEKKYEAIRDRWALYKYAESPESGPHWQRQTAFKGTRIYGHERVNVLIIHFVPITDKTTDLSIWDIAYTVSVKKKRPANVENALALLGAITANAGARVAAAAPVGALWGGGLMCIKDIPSDIIADAEVIPRDTSSNVLQSPKTYSKTYDNEGRYRWDVSVGVPLKEVKEVQYDATEGIVRAKEVNRQNAYGFLNFFFVPVDVKSDDFLNAPHLVLGVPISKKPLDRPIVALGYGIRKFDIKFDFYAGAVFNRVREPRTLDAGESATQGELETDLRSKRVTKFVFGVNFPLRQVKDAISQ